MNRLKLSSLMLLSMLIGLTYASNPVYAQPCPMDDPIHSLPDCITHHWEMGDIDKEGVYRSLLKKAQNAVALYDAGNTRAATNTLNSLIDALEAKSGKHITEEAAEMLIHHAEMAIEQIN
ncbi:MAG TPA: hypothetical protein VIH03_06740 [Nitrososphaerales archaeon]